MSNPTTEDTSKPMDATKILEYLAGREDQDGSLTLLAFEYAALKVALRAMVKP